MPRACQSATGPPRVVRARGGLQTPPRAAYSPRYSGESAMKFSRIAAVLAAPLLFAAPVMAAEPDPVPSAKDYPPPPAGWHVAGRLPRRDPARAPRRRRYADRVDRGSIQGALQPGRAAPGPRGGAGQ